MSETPGLGAAVAGSERGAAGRPRESGVRAGATVAFLSLGLADAMLGVTWPAIRAQLHLPLATLGVVLVASTAAFVLTAMSNGMTLRHVGVLRLLVGSSACGAAGAAAIALAPSLPLLIAGALLLGASAGAMDPAVSSIVSLGQEPSFVNLLHATYGVGAAASPFLVVAALHLASWRLAYVAVAAAELALLFVWLRPAQRALPPLERAATALPRPGHGRVVALSLAAFFLAAGLEITAASWAASFLDDRFGRGSPLVAGGVAAYWVGLTASRVAAALAPRRLPPQPLAPSGALAALVGGALLWLVPATGAVACLGVLGLGTGPIYPALTQLTPLRVGRAAATQTMGWQLAAGSIGSAVCSSLAGVVLQLAAVRALGLVLALLAGCCLAVLIALVRAAPPRPEHVEAAP